MRRWPRCAGRLCGGDAGITVQLETQETITRDGVAVRVNAVLWYRAVDPARVVTSMREGQAAIVQAAETGMRDAIGQSDLDQMLTDRIAINRRLLELLAGASGRWGVEIEAVEIRDLVIPEQMQRGIAWEAEAIRGCCQSNGNLSPADAPPLPQPEARLRGSATQPGRLSVVSCRGPGRRGGAPR